MIVAVATIVIGVAVVAGTLRHMRRHPDVIDLRGIVAAHTVPVHRP